MTVSFWLPPQIGPGPPISHSHCPLLCGWANYWGAEDPLGFRPSSERDWLQVSQVRTSLVAQMVKNLPGMQETWVQSLDREEPLEKGMATYSSILVWSIPWTEESGRIQSMGWKRVRRDKWLTHTQKRLVQGLPGKEGPDEVEDSLTVRLEKPRIRAQIHGTETDARNFLCLCSHRVYNLIDGQEPGMRSTAGGRLCGDQID